MGLDQATFLHFHTLATTPDRYSSSAATSCSAMRSPPSPVTWCGAAAPPRKSRAPLYQSIEASCSTVTRLLPYAEEDTRNVADRDELLGRADGPAAAGVGVDGLGA